MAGTEAVVLPSGGNGPRNGAYHHRGTTITPLTAYGEKWFAEAARAGVFLFVRIHIIHR